MATTYYLTLGLWQCLSITLVAAVNSHLQHPSDLIGADFEMRQRFGRLFNEMKKVTQCFTYV
jgi:hypothetical protein